VIASQSPAEELVATLGLLLIGGFVVWKVWVRWSSSPLPPDPWETVSPVAEYPVEAHPLCPRCLEAHHELERFCPNCGNPVSPYVCCLPFESALCVGFVMRVGAAERYRRSPSAVAGFYLMAAVTQPLLAPFLWYRFTGNLEPNRKLDEESRAQLNASSSEPSL